MAAKSPSPLILLGAKGFSLSPAAVFSISHSLSHVEIDSSALEKLSQQKERLSSSSSSSPNPNPKFQLFGFCGATVAVFLNKLLLLDQPVRGSLPVLLQNILCLPSVHGSLCLPSPSCLLHPLSRCILNLLSFEQISIFESSSSASVAICAILDHCATGLVKISDAIAALSCEASRADVAAFELPVSGDGFSAKDEIDVASDIKMLLFGSKLSDGKNDSLGVFSEIPSVHGSLRAAIRFLHARTCVELNSSVEVNKLTRGFINGKEGALIVSVMPLALSIASMAEISIERSKLIINSIGDEGVKSKLNDIFSECCLGFEWLKGRLKNSFNLIMGDSAEGADVIWFLKGVHRSLIKFREILALEAALGLFSLEIYKSPSDAKLNGEDAEKKKKTLGKGTSVIFQFLRDLVAKGKEVSRENVSVLVSWATDFSSFFDPENSGLEIFVSKIEEIVETNEVRILPKLPKGTRDIGLEQKKIMERAISIITSVFKLHGAVALDTPLFELRETLTGNHGQDSKLIYDLADQGGELCSLRYDLRVPFARHIVLKKISSMRAYQKGKVCRRDVPSREFYQCDFNIAGNFELMFADWEVIVLITQLLNRLDIGSYEIKLNHRKLLDGMMDICGVPPQKFRTICASIGKLNELTLDQVKRELVEEKGLSAETADKIGVIVKKCGDPLVILKDLKDEGSVFLRNAGCLQALKELEILFGLLQTAQCLDKLVFDLSFAGDLDYYTGIIYEAILKDTTPVGSIAAGGRYDNLVGVFSSGKHEVPAVGVSLRVDRVVTIMEQLEKDRNQVTQLGQTLSLPSISEAFAASVAICATLDHCATPLIKIADAVAALSCEPSRADVASFDLPVSAHGFSPKDEIDVASYIKMLLSGSKLSDGKNHSLGVFSEIPSVHGSFRESLRFLHAHTPSSVKVDKSIGGGINGEVTALIASVSPLALSIKHMAEISLQRSRLIINSIGDEGVKSKLNAIFGECCVGFDGLRDGLKENFDFIIGDSAKGMDIIRFLQGVYNSLLKFREILAWEAALGLFSIEIDDSQSDAKLNGENAEKKKKSLGKGTLVIFQFLRDRVAKGEEASSENVSVLVSWASKFSSFFDPKDSGLEIFLSTIEETVETNEIRRVAKVPKGTRDFVNEETAIRERTFNIIRGVFEMHGAGELDTPVFELRETLMGKYGEDSKLIYDLADQGEEELCSLRYDLTVPFARYLAMNNIPSMKRYQMGKVYRRDNPSKGRYREFYQCDFDIAGSFELMEPDLEVLVVLTQLLDRLDIGAYEIKLNHRKLLDSMMNICGVPPEKIRTVCSSIDKLDKQTLEQVKVELVMEKGIAAETAEKIGVLVKKRGDPLVILKELKAEGSEFLQNPGSVGALNELDILFNGLQKAKCLDKLVFDLSLARGLDYYTGVIYEAVSKGTTQVGSIAAGGRYDKLVGMFSGKKVPAVGVSLGIERIFTIMEQDRNQVRATETQVLVSIIGKNINLASQLLKNLWDSNINAESKLTKRIRDHIGYAVDSGIPWMVLVGDSEIKKGIVKLKNVALNQEEEVPRENFVEVLKSRLG